jgi:hypothetical protein
LSIAIRGSTALLVPAANTAVSSSAGDNNGFETDPANAYAAGGGVAVDTNSGTSTSTSCTNAGKDKHIYASYNVTLPGGVSIQGIEVSLTASVNNSGNAPQMCVQLSWNGGSSWTAAQTTPTLTTALTTYIIGGASNLWGRTWTATNFNNTNFRVRIINVAASTARTFSLDAVAVRVTYQ